MSIYYVYVHKTADTGVFYVGKGSNGRAFTGCQRNKQWKQVVEKNGGVFSAEIVKTGFPDSKSAYAFEAQLISELQRSGVTLCNQTAGGEGPLRPMSSEMREKARARMLNNQMTKGRLKPESERMMHSIKTKGKKKHSGFSELLRKANLGKKRPEWAKANMSEAAKARGPNNDMMLKGVANISADKSIYRFRHAETGEIRECYRAEMAWVGSNFKALFRTNKPLKTYFGWEVLECLC